jgi:CHAT domain-containing protein
MKKLTFRLICFILLITQLPIFNLAQTNDSFTFKPEQNKSRVLEKGVSVEREVRSGQIHNYKVTLAAGQYLKVLVAQREVDIFVSLFDPDEKKVVQVNTREYGTEHISVLANASGDYRLEVRSNFFICHPLDKGLCDGDYEIKIVELRESTPQDSIRIKAQQLYSEIGQPRLVKERIEKLKEIRQLWKSVGEVSLEANTLHNIAFEYQLTTERTKALEYYDEALRLFKSVGDRYGEAQAFFRAGNVHRLLGEYEKALDYYEQSLAVYREQGNKRGEFDMLWQISLVYSTAGDYQKALYYSNQQLILSRTLNYPQLNTLMTIGVIFKWLGEKQKAREYYLKALAEIQAIPERFDDVRLLGALYSISVELEDYQKGVEYGNKLAQFHRDRKNRFGEAGWLKSTGIAYEYLGEYQKALDYFSQTLSIYRTIDNPLGIGIQDVLYSLGTVYVKMGNQRTALDYFNQSYLINKTSPEFKALLIYKISCAHRTLGNLDEALLRAEELISTVESQRANITNPELRRDFSARAHEYYRFYIDLLMLIDKRNPSSGDAAKALQVSERFRARSLLESLNEARVGIRQGVDAQLLEREREVQRRLSVAAERQNRLSITKHTEEQAAIAKRDVENATAEYEGVQAQIRRISPHYAALTQPQSLTASEIQRDLLDADTALLEYALGVERGYLWVVTSNSLKTYELPKREEIENDVRRVVSLLSDGKRWVSDEKINAEYADVAALLSRKLLPPSVLTQLKGKRLAIVSDGALQYLPFGALPLPQKSNTKNKTQKTVAVPLAVEHEIVSLPSASALAVQRREAANRKQSAKGIAIFADPVFSETDVRVATVKANQSKVNKVARIDLNRLLLERAFNWSSESNEPLSIPRLPFTRREAEGIFENAPSETTLKALDFEANRNNVLKSDLFGYRIIHFATHGLLNSEHPELSGIVLSLVTEQGRPIDGFLRLNEIYNLNLSADLVVLSACQTALGKEIRGEGLIGLTRGFMYAGSPRVVASLWKVDDAATAALMKLFYQKMLKENMRPAAALRAAKIEMQKQKRWNAPFYWAAFELQGEWR